MRERERMRGRRGGKEESGWKILLKNGNKYLEVKLEFQTLNLITLNVEDS